MSMASAARPLIVGMGGTTRNGSTTEKALRVALRAAEARGANSVFIDGTRLLFPMYEPDTARRSDDVRQWVDLIRRCSGLIIASPGYHGSVSGLVKNALDYLEDLRGDERPYLDGRAVGCIACALGWQASGTTLVALRSIVHALRGWPTPMGSSVNSALELFDEDGNCIHPATRFQLDLIGSQVFEFARAWLDTRRDLRQVS